jgi:hypothetical protein
MVIYTLDGRRFGYWGVHVTKTTGLVGNPDYKTPFTMDWNDQQGTWIDLEHRKYKNRVITMDCFIKTNSEINAWQAYKTFSSYFNVNADTLKRLSVTFTGQAKALLYQVYLEKSEVTYKWRRGQNILKFRLTLIEPEPIKATIEVGIIPTTMTSDSIVTHVMPGLVLPTRGPQQNYAEFGLEITTLVDNVDMGYRINVTLPDGSNSGDVAEYSGLFLCALDTNTACDLIITGDIDKMYFTTARISLTGTPVGYQLYKDFDSDLDIVGGIEW